jgi:hypothetical protein
MSAAERRERRLVPRGLPGGRDRAAGEDRRARPHRAGRLRADPRADPFEARDGRGLPRADRGEQHGRPPPAGASLRGTAARRSRRRCASSSTTPSGARGPSSLRCRAASGRRRAPSTPTVQRRAGASVRARRASRRRRPLRPRGLRSAARAPVNSTYAQTFSACAYAFKCLIDPTSRQRRLLPAALGRRAGGDGDELHLAEPGRRRLGDADAARRRDLPRSPPLRFRSGCRRGRRR